jgi:hypothetical protein
MEKLQKVFAGGGIKPRAWFIENQNAGPGHECAANQYALTFSL